MEKKELARIKFDLFKITNEIMFPGINIFVAACITHPRFNKQQSEGSFLPLKAVIISLNFSNFIYC